MAHTKGLSEKKNDWSTLDRVSSSPITRVEVRVMCEEKLDKEQYVVNHCEAVDGEQSFRDMIDECQGPVCIGSIEFVPSRVLEELDPIAFRCGMSDYMDSEHVEIDGEWYLQQDVLDIEYEWEELDRKDN